MKRLNRIRLINWYHIADETLDLRGSTLFMGDNGSGKSTILDAIQFALVADLSQVRFNHAANENADRTLQSYTRWMTGSMGTKETHLYNRNDCTSYVLLEFQEPTEELGTRSFVVGAAIDSYRDGRDPNRLHFVLNDSALSEIPVFEEEKRLTLNLNQFSKLMRVRKGFFCSREPGPYRDHLLIRLGRLSPDFTRLLVKALAFKPLGKVQEFVTNFLLDPRPLDTRSLQENLSSYKALLQKADDAEKRVTELGRLREVHENYEQARNETKQIRYVELRSRVGIQESLEQELQNQITEKEKTLKDEEQKQTELIHFETKIEEEYASLIRALSEHSGFGERQRTKEDLKRVEHELITLKKQISELVQLEERSKKLIRELKERGHETSWTDFSFSELHFKSRSMEAELKQKLSEIKTRGEEAHARLKDLKKGVKPIPHAARALKSLLQDELHCKPAFLCEVIEVADERWQDAIEGYLNTRRFDILLDPKYFQAALSLYEAHKRRLGIQGVGLVDVEKIHRQNQPCAENTLAQLVVSEHRNAKAYADFLMGDVVRCESELELRRHSRSITPTCMVYQNHAARQTQFEVYATWFIGSRGQARLIEQTEKEIENCTSEFQAYAQQLTEWQAILKIAVEGEKIELILSSLPTLREKEKIAETESTRLLEHLARLENPELIALEKREQELKVERSEISHRIRENAGQIGALKTEIKNKHDARELTQLQIRDESHALDFEFSAVALEERATWEGSYAELLESRTPQDILRTFEPRRKGSETRVQNLMLELGTLRSNYNNHFGFAAPTIGDDLSPYLTELANWQESKLPDYRGKIENAKELALQQLMEDVVHKLRENLDIVAEQFQQINQALEGFHFGQDHYQFVHKVKPEFEPFERMIREAAQYENQPLFETDWKTRFRQGGGLEILFNNLVSGSSTQVETELAQYSDYREYYEYDLKITDTGGRVSYFSRVNKWKSGGETQTPYYIAVIASLYRLYRLQGDSRGTIGLVLLDEAFNKMDEDHLKATLEFTRKLGLQLIMATPKERADFIIPHVESTWLVAKDPETGYAFLHDFHQDLA